MIPAAVGTPTIGRQPTKAGVDGLVDAGLLVDDDHRHLIGPDHRIDPEPCAKGHVRITLILEPVHE